jgi:topoisomerase-4 subunit A
MTDKLDNILNPEDPNNQDVIKLIPISEMYKGWFLDYASYVILERSVPLIYDGLKPVQRRILHSLKEMHDGRYNKVANIIGNTMKYHPHGDASIGDALVKIGQKELLIDMQGNWGNIMTGDRAAAPRYIEARLTEFALEVIFSPKVTSWQYSYDGRSKEPISLPVKFPLLLCHGAEGIAVGLSTKILPHNFIELIDASISILKGKSKKIYPDFITGGIADFSNYNDGKRGGKVQIRAKIHIIETDILKISEIPFGSTTSSIIESIIRANDKGKIKIKKVEDNTSENVEILIYLPSGVSVNKTIDALYAFTDCQISISPLSCTIQDNKPVFFGVSEILKISTNNTKSILNKELKVQLQELEEKWHMLSLERLFIENRIYRQIEEISIWEDVLNIIYKALKPFENTLIRLIATDDVIQLTEIKIKKITRYDLDKEQEKLDKIEQLILEVKHNINNLIAYSVLYFKNLKNKYSDGKIRKTEIKIFDKIVASKVAIANQRLYMNREDGFVGTSLKKDEFVCECSDIDDMIIFKSNGTMLVTRVTSKLFVGKGIIHMSIFKRNDERTIYNMIYRDHITNKSYVKRFPVKGVTRDKEYVLSSSVNATVLYFSANPNGEAELVTILLRAKSKLKKIKFDVNFSEFLIKNRSVKGNLVTQHSVNKIELKSKGISTLSGKKIWFDQSINRINDEKRGEYLGEFSGDDKILSVNLLGYYELLSYDLSNHFSENIVLLEKYESQKVVVAVYYHGVKEQFYIKKFIIQDSSKKVSFIDTHKDSYLELVFFEVDYNIKIEFLKPRGQVARPLEVMDPSTFISIKGLSAMGNQLSRHKIKQMSLIERNQKEAHVDIPDLENSHLNEDLNDNLSSQIKLDF